jgi:hypothetical protein
MSSSNEDSRRASLEAERAYAKQRINRGVIYFVIGFAITIVTFALAKPGGTFIISWGPMVFGALRIIQGSITNARVSSELSRLTPKTSYTQEYPTAPQQASPQAQTHPQYVQQSSSTVPAGWHADPSRRFQYRYWDGSAWTSHVHTNGVAAHDPVH